MNKSSALQVLFSGTNIRVRTRGGDMEMACRNWMTTFFSMESDGVFSNSFDHSIYRVVK